MSHSATNWAIQQRGLKPATKIVLWHLCDRHNPDFGCFPSLDRLANDCEMSRRSVQNHINILVGLGLVSVGKMPRKAGQMPLNCYILAFENGHGQNVPKAGVAFGKLASKPLANPGIRLGQNLPTNLVREPLRETRANAPLCDEGRKRRSAQIGDVIAQMRDRIQNGDGR